MNIHHRAHGSPPFNILALHGGPGAPGGLRPFCEQLSTDFSLLEPFQTAHSIDGQVQELHETITALCQPPVTLIGWSWGAWLGWIFTAGYPQLVNHLILISSGPFEAHYAPQIEATRTRRLSSDERAEIQTIMNHFSDPSISDKSQYFSRFGQLYSKADNYESIDVPDDNIGVDFDLFNAVWTEAAELRRSGELLKLSEQIRCPVTAIHGDYDPHPWQGVKEPLEKTLTNFTFYLLSNCGHEPWCEKHAREEFFYLLKQTLT